MQRRHGPGFTLTELLILVAILALLAAILFPLGTRLRDRARLSACASHLRQYSAAFSMYAQEYDATLPPWSVEVPYRRGALSVTTWDLLLRGYLKDPAAGRCPSDPAPAFFVDGAGLHRVGGTPGTHEVGGDGVPRDGGTTVWRSYSVPRNLVWNRGETDNPRDDEFPMKLAAIPRPEATLLLCERTQGTEVSGRPYPATRTLSSSWLRAAAFENFAQVAWERHQDRVNVLFVDGHVKQLDGCRPGRLRDPPDPRDCRFAWPKLPGYVERPGAASLFARDANGAQFWEDCPIPGEPPTKSCH